MSLETQDGGDAGAFDYTDATSTFGDRLCWHGRRPASAGSSLPGGWA